MNVTLFPCLLFIFLSGNLFSQKHLIIEKSGRVKTERLEIYDEITFRLNNDDKGWYTRQILDLNADAQLVLLGDTWMPLADISRIYLKRKRVLATIIGGAMQGGGAYMILGDAYYTVRGRPEFTDGGLEFGILNILAGTLVRAVLGPVKYKLGKRVRLRVIDITYRSAGC